MHTALIRSLFAENKLRGINRVGQPHETNNKTDRIFFFCGCKVTDCGETLSSLLSAVPADSSCVKNDFPSQGGRTSFGFKPAVRKLDLLFKQRPTLHFGILTFLFYFTQWKHDLRGGRFRTRTPLSWRGLGWVTHYQINGRLFVSLLMLTTDVGVQSSWEVWGIGSEEMELNQTQPKSHPTPQNERCV